MHELLVLGGVEGATDSPELKLVAKLRAELGKRRLESCQKRPAAGGVHLASSGRDDHQGGTPVV